ncbi:esterase/lipase family protein [Microbacterium sp. P06]|uniref:esterase/lipase family protein n=1 Tax=Microbacterium sp. P06 TaxID=3366949 RepID=UPI003745BBF8
MNPLRVPIWWARDYAYALTWQVRAFFNRTDPMTFLTGDKTPIIVLPGIYETWKFMQPLIEALHERGHPIHVIDLLRRNERPVVEMAERVTEYLDAHDLSDVVLMAHSKGGLVGKQAMVVGAAGRRVRGMLAVATPFGGSRYARLMVLAPTLRIFSPRNATILALAKETAVNERIVSVYGRFDPHIPEGSELAGAKNVRLETGGHFRILAHPRVLAELAVLAG